MTTRKTTTQKRTPIKTKVTEVKKLTEEEQILGEKPVTIVKTSVDYENFERKYKVTNLEFNNTPVKVDGTVIETFIGSNNKEARKALKEGALEVITRDMNGKEIYKIEVL